MMNVRQAAVISWPTRKPEYNRSYPRELNLAHDVLSAGDATRPAIRDPHGTTTYEVLRRDVSRVGRALLKLGVGSGEKLLILSQNSRAAAVVFLAANFVGAVPTLANSLLRKDEIAYIAANSGAKHVMTGETAIDAVRTLQEDGAVFKTTIVSGIAPGDSELAFEELLEAPAGEAMQLQPATTDANQPAFMVYSSGTTGRPKGIVHAHRWIRTMGDPIAARNEYSEDDVVLATGEFSFVAALGSGLLHPLRAGACVSLLDGRPSPERVMETVMRDKVTIMYSVPTLYRMLLTLEQSEIDERLATLRYCSSAGEALTASGCQDWSDRVCPMYESYGVSEMQMVISNGPAFPVKPGSVGKVLPGIEARIIDDDGKEVGPGEVGLLAIPASDEGLSLGYHEQPVQWSSMFRDGWFVTEDQFAYDEDGYLWHQARIGDLFKSRGYLISPAEIESACQDFPGVHDVAVIGLPDDIIGKRLVAVVVPVPERAGDTVWLEGLKSHLKAQLAPYKLPREYWIRESLPRSVQGKLLRREVAGGIEV